MPKQPQPSTIRSERRAVCPVCKRPYVFTRSERVALLQKRVIHDVIAYQMKGKQVKYIIARLTAKYHVCERTIYNLVRPFHKLDPAREDSKLQPTATPLT